MKMGHVGDMAFLPEKKKKKKKKTISPGHVDDTAFLYRAKKIYHNIRSSRRSCL